MNGKKFAAHFMLAPGGKFLKWPVIEVDGAGLICEVRTSEEGLKEEPGLSFFPGILLPGFIDVFVTANFPREPRFFNRHFSQGTLCLGFLSGGPFDATTKVPVPCAIPSPKTNVGFNSDGEVPLWERLKTFALAGDREALPMLLHEATAGAAQYAGLDGAGELKKGKSPGILLLRDADLAEKRLTPRAFVQWLNVPSEFYLNNFIQQTK